MSRSSNTPRCKCCDEVIEELLIMRQSFEKLLHRLTNNVVDLRREVTEALKGKNDAKELIEANHRKVAKKSTSNHEPSAQVPMQICIKNEAEMDIVDVGFNDINSDNPTPKPNAQVSISMENAKLVPRIRVRKFVGADCSNATGDDELLRPLFTNQTETTTMEQHIQPSTNENVRIESQSTKDYFTAQGRVLPKIPFGEAQQFEDWNAMLLYDEKQREKLRAELLQDVFDEPDKYIRHCWRSLLKNDAAMHYSYRGVGACRKKAIRGYIFTDIFIECFQQRFPLMNEEFFAERSMRFFNYAHDYKRKMERERRKQMKSTATFPNNTSLDEPTIESSGNDFSNNPV